MKNINKNKNVKITLFILLISIFACSTKDYYEGNPGDIYRPDPKEQAKERIQGYEVPPVLKARELVSNDLLRSENHAVLSSVYNDGFYNHYSIKTTWGDLYAGSDEKLKIRINEINAISELKKIKTNEVLVDGAKTGGKKILMAPVKVIEAVGGAIIHPVDTTKKIVAIPLNVVDFFSGIVHKIGSANDNLQDNDSDFTSKESAESGMTQLFNVGANYAKQWIGYTSNVRDLEKQFGILPDTDNQILQDEITRIASIKTSVTFSTKFVPGIPMFEVISEANSALGMVDKISVYEDKVVQEEMVFKELSNLGIPEKTIYKFQNLDNLTTTSRTIITNAILNLEGVKERESLITIALGLESEDAGTIYTSIVSTLPYLNKKYHFNRFLTTTFLPVAITNDKKAITTLQTDYIFWTKTLATIIESALTKIKGNANNFELVIRGKISKRTLSELSKRNIKVSHIEDMLEE